MPEPSVDTREVEDVTCLACGCLCDDIVATVADGRIVAARNACSIGLPWFLQGREAAGLPGAAIEGRAVPLGEAVARAAEILAGSRSPVLLGLSASTLEAQGAAAELADRIGATIVLANAAEADAIHRAVQRVGRVSATLGEVKNRADLVVFWGVDPIVTHPRHWDRYSVEPRGRFVPDGRAGRTVVVCDESRTATADRADLFVPVGREDQLETLWALRAMVKGIAVDPKWDRLRDLADRMKQARYGAFFFGPSLGRSSRVEAALTLVRDLNDGRRFVALGLGGPGNPSGAEAVLTWQAGYPYAVDFALGWPRFLPQGASDGPLERGEADAVLVLGDLDAVGLSPAARAHLERIPLAILAPGATARNPGAAVAISTATAGLDAPGTVMRTDGVTLPLRPPLAARSPTERDLLHAIIGLIETQQGRS